MRGRYCNGFIHVVKRGETLYQISRRYRVPLALILRANPYVDVYNLQPGQEVCIPMAKNGSRMMNEESENRENGERNRKMVGEHWNEDGVNQSNMQISIDRIPNENSSISIERSMSMENSMPKENSMPMQRTMPKENSMSMQRTIPMEKSIPIEKSIPMENSMSMENSIPMEMPMSAEIPMQNRTEKNKVTMMSEMERMGNEGGKAEEKEVYITESVKSLGDILIEFGVTLEEFSKYNDLSEVLLAENVIVYLPKKI